jgi:ubiquinone/menaquinone biosynthesis C-methylase UbiE
MFMLKLTCASRYNTIIHSQQLNKICIIGLIYSPTLFELKDVMSPINIDPEENEVRHILRYALLDGMRVLDIGCGDGKLTCEYAARAASVIAFDPDISDLRTAVNERPEELSQRVQFLAAQAGSLPLPKDYFDTAIFTSSL